MKRRPGLLTLMLASAVVAQTARQARAQEVAANVDERPPSGLELLVTGSIVTGLAVVDLAAGPPVCVDYFSTEVYPRSTRTACITATLVMGGMVTAVGIPLLVVGAGQSHRFKEWQRQHPYLGSLTLAPIPGGGGAMGMRWAF
jgi:hypothetical protein